MRNRERATRWIFSSLVAGAATAVLSAQAPQAPQPPAAKEQGKKVTMIGCVERADQFASSGTPSPVATTADSQSFVLIKVEPPAASAGDPVGTTGTTAGSGKTVASGSTVARANAAIGNMYKLEGDTGVIATHVGHKVEIVGTIDPSSPAARPPDPQNPSAATSPVLVVDRVKQIADLCPR